MFVLIGIAAVLSVILNSHSFISSGYSLFGALGGLMGALIGLFFLIVFVWFIIWIFRFVGWSSRSWRYQSGWWDHDESMEILRERYAKGEITKEEYYRLMSDLKRINYDGRTKD